MNKTRIYYIITALFLLTAVSCNRERKIDTEYFSLEYPSQWKAEKATEDNNSFNGITLVKRSGSSIDNIAVMVYMNQSTDPAYMIHSQVKEKVNSIMRNADSGDITDTIFKDIPAKKIKFTNAMLDGNLLSGNLICFVNGGVTYLLYDMYPKSEYKNAGRSTEMFQKMEFKKNVKPIKNDDIYTVLKDYEKTLAQILPTSLSDNVEMTEFKVEKGRLVYSCKITNTSKDDFTGESLMQWKEAATPLVLDDLIKSRNTLELMKKAMSANYSFTYKYYDRDNNFLYELTFTDRDYNK